MDIVEIDSLLAWLATAPSDEAVLRGGFKKDFAEPYLFFVYNNIESTHDISALLMLHLTNHYGHELTNDASLMNLKRCLSFIRRKLAISEMLDETPTI